MVKNTTGGTGTKSLARKHMNKGKDANVRTPTEEAEKFGYVSQIFGQGMVEILIAGNIRLIGHIRNKFRGKQKRHNLITRGSIVLIGMRTWESVPKNCDILTIYDDNDIKSLKNRSDLDIDEVIKLQQENTINHKQDVTDELEFSNKYEEDEDDDLAELEKLHKTSNTFKITHTDEIDMDDI